MTDERVYQPHRHPKKIKTKSVTMQPFIPLKITVPDETQTSVVVPCLNFSWLAKPRLLGLKKVETVQGKEDIVRERVAQPVGLLSLSLDDDASPLLRFE